MVKVGLWCGILLLVTPMLAGAGQPRLASVFSDHMVLQRDKPVRVWGSADPAAEVEVTFGDQRKTTVCKPDGSWLVILDPMLASSESRNLSVSTTGGSIILSDLLVGEVWLLGGQSNMEMPLWWRGDSDGLKNAKDTRLVLGTDHPWLRIMTVPQGVSRERSNHTIPERIVLHPTCDIGVVDHTAEQYFPRNLLG